MRTARRLLRIPEMGILIPLAVFLAAFLCIDHSFLSPKSVAAMLRGIAFAGIIAIAQTWLMVSGEIDLSVGSVAGLCAVAAAWLMKEAGCPIAVGLLGGLAAGAAAGFVNGVVAIRFGIPGFIATLGMLYIARGLNYVLCKGYPVYPVPDALKDFGKAEPFGVSWAFVIFVALVLVGDFCLRKTVFGRKVLATGGNSEVARIAGINTNAVKISCYTLTGMMAAVAGMLLMAQLNVGQPEIGTGWELEVIASVVIGGVSLFGGVGTVIGTFLGLLTMQVVRSGLSAISASTEVEISTHWQTVAVGVILIVAVGVDVLRRRAKMS